MSGSALESLGHVTEVFFCAQAWSSLGIAVGALVGALRGSKAVRRLTRSGRSPGRHLRFAVDFALPFTQHVSLNGLDGLEPGHVVRSTDLAGLRTHPPSYADSHASAGVSRAV